MNKPPLAPTQQTNRLQMTSNRKFSALYVALVATYAVAWQFFPPGYHAAETLMVVLFIAALSRNGSEFLRRDPVFLCCALLLVYLLFSCFWHWHQLPEHMELNIRFARYYLKPLLIVVIAYGLTLKPGLSPWSFLALAWLGIVLGLMVHLDLAILKKLAGGSRQALGFMNAQHAGVVFGTALIGFVVFLPRAFTLRFGKYRGLVAALAVASLTIALAAVIVTQVRAVWLALLVSLPVGILTHYRTRSREGSSAALSKNLAITLVAVLSITTAILLETTTLRAHIERRLSVDAESLNTLRSAAGLETISMTSTAIRAASWASALRWHEERPLLGWGPGTTEDLIEREPYFSDSFKRQFGHVHNSYLEALVSLGLVGLLPLLALTLCIGWKTIQAYRYGAMPRDVFVFAWTFFTFWSVTNFFESYIIFNTGHFLNACIGGFLYHFYLKTVRPSQGI